MSVSMGDGVKRWTAKRKGPWRQWRRVANQLDAHNAVEDEACGNADADSVVMPFQAHNAGLNNISHR